ncbi:unnamed protein product, partial [Rhizoctonia solani]
LDSYLFVFHSSRKQLPHRINKPAICAPQVRHYMWQRRVYALVEGFRYARSVVGTAAVVYARIVARYPRLGVRSVVSTLARSGYRVVQEHGHRFYSKCPSEDGLLFWLTRVSKPNHGEHDPDILAVVAITGGGGGYMRRWRIPDMRQALSGLVWLFMPTLSLDTPISGARSTVSTPASGGYIVTYQLGRRFCSEA